VFSLNQGFLLYHILQYTLNRRSCDPWGEREQQFKKKHWELNFTNDASLALPETLQVTEADSTKWKQSYVYGAGGERLSMTYLPAYDANNGWEPTPGAGGAEPGVQPKTLWYMQDALGSTIGLVEKDGRVSSRYHYDEFGVPLDAKKFDLNWPGPDNLFGYTGLGYDYASGNTYARARYYKPEIGRFVSEDSYKGDIWNPQSLNRFTYVHNNPFRYIDPSGHRMAGDELLPQWIQNEINVWGEKWEDAVCAGGCDYSANPSQLESVYPPNIPGRFGGAPRGKPAEYFGAEGTSAPSEIVVGKTG